MKEKMTKSFIITVDTEGDNLWNWKAGQQIKTENAKFIPRFQQLCEKYGFKPVYLTNYEMANDEFFVKYFSQKNREGLCEIGMHLHAWNTPPEYELPNRFGGNPYITEYPKEIVEQKVKNVMGLLKNKFESDIVSHRSGRWAINDDYLNILKNNGIAIDCSVTPGLDLSKISGLSCNCGNNYKGYSKNVCEIIPGILEIPMTTRSVRRIADGSIKHKLKTMILGDAMWLRPIKKSLDELCTLTNVVSNEKGNDYLEFMIHSSELMPGGSIYFNSSEDIEKLYDLLEMYFEKILELNYTGATLKEYAKKYCGRFI